MIKSSKEKPDILLFDLESPHTEAVFSYLESNPGLLLIGLSPYINLVQVWSGLEFRELSTQSLLELINGEDVINQPNLVAMKFVFIDA